MKRCLAVVAIALGCGSNPPPPESPPPGPADPTPVEPEPEPVAAEPPAAEPEPADPIAQACKQLTTLAERDKCPSLVKSNFNPATCVEDLGGARKAVNEAAFNNFVTCLGGASECGAIKTCSAELMATSPPKGRSCGDVGLGAVSLTADEASKRYGQGVTKLSAAPTSMAKPIEVCGVAAEHAWLRAARCDDGSAPLARGAAAPAQARVGSRGTGGRCKSTIDLYRVKCPEKTYDVFMDLYMCGPGETI